jgi:hypothetical protein
VHELAHAAVARSYGIPVTDIARWPIGGAASIQTRTPNPLSP